MLNLAIRIYYVAVPACMVLQTIVLGYMAAVLNKVEEEKKMSEVLIMTMLAFCVGFVIGLAAGKTN